MHSARVPPNTHQRGENRKRGRNHLWPRLSSNLQSSTESNSCWNSPSGLTQISERHTVEPVLDKPTCPCAGCPVLVKTRSPPILRGVDDVEGERSVTVYAQLVWIIQPPRCIHRLPRDPIINHLPAEHQPRLRADSLAECCYLAPGEARGSVL